MIKSCPAVCFVSFLSLFGGSAWSTSGLEKKILIPTTEEVLHLKKCSVGDTYFKQFCVKHEIVKARQTTYTTYSKREVRTKHISYEGFQTLLSARIYPSISIESKENVIPEGRKKIAEISLSFSRIKDPLLQIPFGLLKGDGYKSAQNKLEMPMNNGWRIQGKKDGSWISITNDGTISVMFFFNVFGVTQMTVENIEKSLDNKGDFISKSEIFLPDNIGRKVTLPSYVEMKKMIDIPLESEVVQNFIKSNNLKIRRQIVSDNYDIRKRSRNTHLPYASTITSVYAASGFPVQLLIEGLNLRVQKVMGFGLFSDTYLKETNGLFWDIKYDDSYSEIREKIGFRPDYETYYEDESGCLSDACIGENKDAFSFTVLR